MSWTADITIGELRPWPSVVLVKRGNTDETKEYTPATTAKCSWQDEKFHVELPELPKEVRVTLPDSRGGNRVRSARVWVYTPTHTATRRIRSHDGIGRCTCSECGGDVDTGDRYCRHCRAEFVGSEYEGREAE